MDQEEEFRDDDYSEGERSEGERSEGTEEEDKDAQLMRKIEDDLKKINDNLEEYVDLCNQIKNVKDELKIFTERKMELEQSIEIFMKKNQTPEFVTRDGKSKIRLFESKQKAPLNKDYLREAVASKVSDTALLEEIIKVAFNRPSNNSYKVKLYSPKKK